MLWSVAISSVSRPQRETKRCCCFVGRSRGLKHVCLISSNPLEKLTWWTKNSPASCTLYSRLNLGFFPPSVFNLFPIRCFISVHVLALLLLLRLMCYFLLVTNFVFECSPVLLLSFLVHNTFYNGSFEKVILKYSFYYYSTDKYRCKAH